MNREPLQNLREGENIDFAHFDMPFTGRGNNYADGRLGEIFLCSGKTGTALQITMHDSAVAASLALQYGCPVEVLRGACLRGEDGAAAGPLGHLLDILASDNGGAK